MSALRRGSGLVVYRLDRLARSVYLSHLIEQAVKKRGAVILSASGEGTWTDTPENRLIRHILNALAEYERKVIASRTRVAMLRHQANGRRMSDTPPYGYARDPDNAALLVEVPEERAIIDSLIELWEFRKMSAAAISRAMMAAGVPFRGRARWHARTVGRILKREGVR